MYSVKGGKLIFSIEEDASQYTWHAEGLPTRAPDEHDFFRVFLDNGEEREIAVFSKQQKGTVTKEANGIRIDYASLTDEFGREYDISLTVYMYEEDGTMAYYAEVENRSDVRVNEVECPFIELEVIGDEHPYRDMLYRANDLGDRFPDPMNFVRYCHTEYMAGDYEHVWTSETYPYSFSMPWYGVESAGHFLYVGRHDDQFRTCSFSLGTSPRERVVPEIVFNISHYPAATKGERITCGKGVVALIEGNWKNGADIFKKWTRTWYTPPAPVKWVKNMTGWQRIILKHQFGRIYFTYDDLVKVYENGRKCGLDTLLVFGWWKGRFDNGYPTYEPDEALGGADALRAAIKKIQSLGGRVILYNNGVLLDVTTDYYKEIGHKIAKKNLDGVEYREYYQFSDYGMTLRTFGYKCFTSACHATDEWKSKLIENAKIKLSFDPDSLFYDQLGGHLPRFCFDQTHKHGKRIDTDAQFKVENIKAVRDIVPEGKCVGTENVVDVFAPYFDFCHGCHKASYGKHHFPSIYRYVFPETVITNRFVHDQKPTFKIGMNYAFVNGLRFDVSVYRGRMIDISGQPEYEAYVKYLLDLRKEYRDYFYDGTFLGDDTSLARPFHVTANLFEGTHGNRLLVLWNDSKEDYTADIYGKTRTVPAGELALIEL